jgi:quinol monooxygenase YgiN
MQKKSLIVKVRPEKVIEFRQTILSLQNHGKEKKGEKIFMIDQEPEDKNVFRLTFEWKSKQESESYYNSEIFKVFLGALKTLCTKSEWK